MKRSGSAIWDGDLKSGAGTVSTGSGALSRLPYSFRDRFEDGGNTNPEELIGAAHAGCYSMALAMIVGDHGLAAERIETTATVTLHDVEGGVEITAVHLDVAARVPGADAETFRKATESARAGCPVSRLMTAEVTMDARLL